MNISIIIRLSWNQFRCLVQYSVHKRITVSSKQGQGKNKQMFAVNKHMFLYVRKIFLSRSTALEIYRWSFEYYANKITLKRVFWTSTKGIDEGSICSRRCIFYQCMGSGPSRICWYFQLKTQCHTNCRQPLYLSSNQRTQGHQMVGRPWPKMEYKTKQIIGIYSYM